MHRILLVAAAVSLAFSGSVLAGGTKHLKRGAAISQGSTSTQITLGDCQMLSVSSARIACERSASRGNGGIDSAAVAPGASATAGTGGTSAIAGGAVSGSVSSSTSSSVSSSVTSHSSDTGTVTTYSNSSTISH